MAARLTAEEIAWAPAQTLADVAVDPQVHAAGGIVEMPGKDGVGSFTSPGGPARFHGVDDGPKGPGPKLGEHTREVLTVARLCGRPKSMPCLHRKQCRGLAPVLSRP